jgi:hypothetical protein
MFFPLKENADVRAATRRPASWVSALMMSSEMPSEKYSFSGSPLMLANGSTAIERSSGSTSWEPVRTSRDAAKRSTVANRSSGARAIALEMAASMFRETLGRLVLTRGAGRVKRCTRMASMVAPVKGASPASIS